MLMKRLAALLVVGLAAAAVACADGGGEKPSPTGTPVATSTLVSGQVPSEIDGVTVQPLALGDEVELPEGFSFVVAIGCIECHCPCVDGLVAVSRAASGDPLIEALFPPKSGLPPRVVADTKAPGGTREDLPYINGGFVANGDGSQIAVTVCSRGSCGPIDEGTPDAQTTVYRSSDGGESWEALGTLGGIFYADAIARDGVVIDGPHTQARQAEFRRQLFPGGNTVEPPAAAVPGAPFSLPNGELVWRTEEGAYVRSDGSVFLALDVEPLDRIVPGPGGDGYVIQWGEPADVRGFNVVGSFGIVDGEGELLQAFSAPAGRLEFGAWLNSTRAIANAWVIPPDAEFSLEYYRPVIVDLETTTIHPIAMPNRTEVITGPGILRNVLSVRATSSP